eukprot:2018510-Pleurochrysis_carterae.AAC.11
MRTHTGHTQKAEEWAHGLARTETRARASMRARARSRIDAHVHTCARARTAAESHLSSCRLAQFLLLPYRVPAFGLLRNIRDGHNGKAMEDVTTAG